MERRHVQETPQWGVSWTCLRTGAAALPFGRHTDQARASPVSTPSHLAHFAEPRPPAFSAPPSRAPP
eukprot:CAMPEP_0174902556 /NCGR_PEP_ID=MMETSP0167-20121228/38471_1 /TAXON_ID=38298 /ORGANISM="Rhodella maculata, Strain CCMP736" /LENGTH=66 /DNA_ID=CAMNT_0016144607 /DNA_START=283 /DNA_END=480 /DNA_ORIENTATION=+